MGRLDAASHYRLPCSRFVPPAWGQAGIIMVNIPARLQAFAAKRICLNARLAAGNTPHVIKCSIDRVIGQVNQPNQLLFLQCVTFVFECIKLNFIGHVLVWPGVVPSLLPRWLTNGAEWGVTARPQATTHECALASYLPCLSFPAPSGPRGLAGACPARRRRRRVCRFACL